MVRNRKRRGATWLASHTLGTALLLVASTTYAHHGGGRFDSSRAVALTGKLTKIDFINPHSWIYFDVKGADGTVKPYRCETRSAHTLRRSGWTRCI